MSTPTKYAPKSNAALVQPASPFETDLLNSCKELRAVTAACFRAIGEAEGLLGITTISSKLSEELARVGIEPGFGIRASSAIEASEVRHQKPGKPN